MSKCSRRDKVRRPGADGSRARHHPSPEVRLRVGDRCMGHRLFVVCPIRRQPVAILIQGLPEARDVSVTEDREDSAKKRNDFVALRTFNPCAQTRKVAHKGLCSRQPHGPAFGNAGFLWKGYRFIHAG